MTNTSPPTEAATLLRECRTIAVVGLSPKAHRDSHHVALYLQQQGYRIVPVNPLATEILGERCWPSLTEAARHVQIDLVDVFRQSDEVPAIADEAIAIGARFTAHPLGAKAIVAVTDSGSTALWMSRHRSHIPI